MIKLKPSPTETEESSHPRCLTVCYNLDKPLGNCLSDCWKSKSMLKVQHPQLQTIRKCTACKGGKHLEMPNGRCLITCENIDSDLGTCLPSSCSSK